MTSLHFCIDIIIYLNINDIFKLLMQGLRRASLYKCKFHVGSVWNCIFEINGVMYDCVYFYYQVAV